MQFSDMEANRDERTTGNNAATRGKKRKNMSTNPECKVRCSHSPKNVGITYTNFLRNKHSMRFEIVFFKY